MYVGLQADYKLGRSFILSIKYLFSSIFQPVPWQGGFKNPYRGIIVWPEPDLVKTKLTLFKVK